MRYSITHIRCVYSGFMARYTVMDEWQESSFDRPSWRAPRVVVTTFLHHDYDGTFRVSRPVTNQTTLEKSVARDVLHDGFRFYHPLRRSEAFARFLQAFPDFRLKLSR